MSDVFSRIEQFGVEPVIKLEMAEHARALGRALVEGGLLVAEVTFRSAAAAGAIALLRKEYPELLVVNTPAAFAHRDPQIQGTNCDKRSQHASSVMGRLIREQPIYLRRQRILRVEISLGVTFLYTCRIIVRYRGGAD